MSCKPEIDVGTEHQGEVTGMINKNFTTFCSVFCLLISMAPQARGGSARYLPLESLLGKFSGIIQVENSKPVEHTYQTEIVAIDKPANTVSLTASCMDCGTKQWTRKDCLIREATDRIRFICKGSVSDEAYTFDGSGLKGTGFGNKYPYSIHVTKL